MPREAVRTKYSTYEPLAEKMNWFIQTMKRLKADFVKAIFQLDLNIHF